MSIKNTDASKQLPDLVLEKSINHALLGNYSGEKMKPAQKRITQFRAAEIRL
jgi:hypothetical protein